MAKFSLGDEVLVYQPSYRNGQPGSVIKATVVKEGRKYVYIDGDGGNWRLAAAAFDKETGRMKTDPSRSSHYDPVLWVPEEWEAKEHRSEVLAAIREHGVRFERIYVSGKPSELPTSTLERLLAALVESDG